MVTELLKEYGLDITPDRIRILKTFLQNQTAISVMELKERAQLNCNKTTVYRTIETFLKKGLIHKVADFDGTVRYGLTPLTQVWQQCEHLHFKCLGCDTVLCLFQISVETPVLPEGYVAQKTDMLVVGLCADCSLL